MFGGVLSINVIRRHIRPVIIVQHIKPVYNRIEHSAGVSSHSTLGRDIIATTSIPVHRYINSKHIRSETSI